MAESTWGTVYLEDIPTVTLMSELLRRRKCASKPEKRLVFIGPPGSRTETLSPIIKDEFCLCHLTINSMVDYAVAANTPLGVKAKETMNNKQLISEELLAGIMDEALNTPRCQKGFLLDGFPGTLKQAEKIDEMLDRRGTPIDKVFYFAIDDSFLEERSGFGRWLPAFYKEIQPVIDHYTKKGNLVNIPAGKTPGEVMEEVKEVVSTI